MNLAQIGRFLILAGLILSILGGFLLLLGKIPGINSFPGTIRIEQGRSTFIVPILASIIISLVLTLILNLVIRLLGK